MIARSRMELIMSTPAEQKQLVFKIHTAPAQLEVYMEKDWANDHWAMITCFKGFDRRVLDEFQEAQDDQ